MTVQNPYAPPAVDVTDAEESYGGEETLIPDGQTCPAGSGWAWFVEGWRIFKAAPFQFWVALLIIMMVFIVMSIIPLVNFLTSICMPIFIAGFGSCARSAMRDGSFEIGQVFDGFRHRMSTQLLCGLIYFALSFGSIFIIAMGFGASGLMKIMMGHGQQVDPAAFGPSIAIAVLVMSVVFVFIYAAFIYAPYLIHEHEDISAPAAMMMSFKACFKNVASGFVFFLAAMVLTVLATSPLLLGWLVLIPVMYLAIYASYREIFIGQAAED